MYVIFYDKTTSLILGFREDLSSPEPTAEHLLNIFLADRNITDDSITQAILLGVKLDDFESGKYLYNASSNTVIQNPNFVAPAPRPDRETVA